MFDVKEGRATPVLDDQDNTMPVNDAIMIENGPSQRVPTFIPLNPNGYM